MKITTTIIYFQEKVCIKINQIHNIFELIFVYYKCYISIELTSFKEFMSIRQANQKSAIFVTIGCFFSAIDAKIY